MYCIAGPSHRLDKVKVIHTYMYSQKKTKLNSKLFHIYDHNRAIFLCSLNLHLYKNEDDDDKEERKEEVRTMNGSCNV